MEIINALCHLALNLCGQKEPIVTILSNCQDSIQGGLILLTHIDNGFVLE